jgi:Trk K+ transport system NAD-binding subunit
MARKNRENEFAVIGLGRFGINLARRLEELGHPVLGIERDPHLANEM